MFRVINPATEETLAELREDTESNIGAKMEIARNAALDWQSTPFQERKNVIGKFRSLLETQKEECAKVLTREMGKPIKQARNEIQGVLERIDYFLAETEGVLQSEQVFGDGKTSEVIEKKPLGVIANISAWNYPYFVGMNVIIPALLTGNAVIYKPSEFASMSGLKITELLYKAGVPKDVFQTVLGSGKSGEQILSYPVDGIFFTGSYNTGIKISERAAKKLIRLQLELGGKDPVYVCEDVDVPMAVASIADGAFYNTGQSCCSVERIYVHEKIHDQFLEAFVEQVSKYQVGDPMDDNTYIGPLARSTHLYFLEDQVKDAVSKGATVKLGGKVRGGKGAFFEPTVLSEVTHDMRVMREESFGPIIGIQSVSSDEQAVERMIDTEYGLTAGVYSQDETRARSILSKVPSGSGYWNCCDRVSPRLPWTGWKNSGVGVTLSHYGILAFLKYRGLHLVKP